MLYAVVYTLKMSYKTDYKIKGFFEYAEGLCVQFPFSESDLCSDIESKITQVQNVAPCVEVLAISSLNGDFDEDLNSHEITFTWT